MTRSSVRVDPRTVADLAESPDPNLSCDARDTLVAAVRQVFGMAPFDEDTGAGATEQHCLDAWNSWAEYLAKKKKTPASTPT